MARRRRLARLWAVAVLALGWTLGVQAHDTRYAIIGTGGITGVYYPTGGAICRMINRNRSEHGVRCVVESTQGSVYNLQGVRSHDLELGVVQSDAQYRALKGTGEFKTVGPDDELRAVFSIYQEPFTLVARKEAEIQRLEDLKGKRVNIGNPGSGHRATMDVLMEALGWTQNVFFMVSELTSADQSEALCRGQFDAMVFAAGHPSGSIKEATTDCNSVLVNVGGPAVEKMIADNPYYSAATIPAGIYRGNEAATRTFGVSATLVASVHTSDEIIYYLVKAVFENFETFKKLHPAFQGLRKQQMIKDSLSAPLHDGAIKYYKEAGLM